MNIKGQGSFFPRDLTDFLNCSTDSPEIHFEAPKVIFVRKINPDTALGAQKMQHQNVDFAGAYIVPTLNLLLKAVILLAATLWAAAKAELATT